MELQPAGHFCWLISHASHHEIDPIVHRKLAPDAAVILKIKCGDLDRRELINPEWILALRLFVVFEAHVELRPDTAHQQPLIVSYIMRRDVEKLATEVNPLCPVVGVDEAYLHLIDEGEFSVFLHLPLTLSRFIRPYVFLPS